MRTLDSEILKSVCEKNCLFRNGVLNVNCGVESTIINMVNHEYI